MAKSFLVCAAALLASMFPSLAQEGVPQGHPDDYSPADIAHGARIYSENCDRCHGANGTGVDGVDFRSGKFRNADTDRQLAMVIGRGFPTAGMPPFALDTADMTGVIAYIRNINNLDRGSIKSGNADHGRSVFEGKGTCLSCHRVKDKGSRKAPDLSDIGATRSAGTIERALTDPQEQLFPINRAVHIVTREGNTINGHRLNEDTYTVQLTDDEGRLISLAKSDLREYTISTKAAMPSFKGELTQDELADLVSYLLTLKGQ